MEEEVVGAVVVMEEVEEVAAVMVEEVAAVTEEVAAVTEEAKPS